MGTDNGAVHDPMFHVWVMGAVGEHLRPYALIAPPCDQGVTLFQ